MEGKTTTEGLTAAPSWSNVNFFFTFDARRAKQLSELSLVVDCDGGMQFVLEKTTFHLYVC